MRSYSRLLISCAVLLAINVTGRAEEPITAAIPDRAWDAAFDRADGWIGGDAIYSTPLPGGDVLWLFADTYIGEVREGRRQSGLRMVNNTLARHRMPAAGAAPDPAAVTFLWGAGTDGEDAKAWIHPDRKLPAGPRTGRGDWYWLADATLLPAGAAQERLVFFLWRTARSLTDGLGFKSVGSALAIVDNPAADWTTWQPRQFAIPDAFPATANPSGEAEILWGSELIVDSQTEQGPQPRHEPELYVFGCRQRPKGANELVVARVAVDKVEECTQWRFRTVDGWSDQSQAAVTLATYVTTEFSVTRLPAGEHPLWVLIHTEAWFGTRIMARTARSMFGPWSKATPVYQVPDVDGQKKHFTYAAKAHPEISRPGELLVSYVVNSFDFGESSSNAAIYRPRFVRVPYGVLPEPPNVK